jgi:hypothetical protein
MLLEASEKRAQESKSQVPCMFMGVWLCVCGGIYTWEYGLCVCVWEYGLCLCVCVCVWEYRSALKSPNFRWHFSVGGKHVCVCACVCVCVCVCVRACVYTCIYNMNVMN